MAHADDEGHPTPSGRPSPEEILRVVLGEASHDESAAMRERLAHDPASARTAGILRDVQGVFTELAAEAAEQPSPAATARAKALAGDLPRVPAWFDRLTATVLARIDGAAADLAAGFAPAPALRGAGKGAMKSFADAALRLDAEPQRNADGSFLIRMQVDAEQDGSLAGDYIVIEASSGAVLASGRTSDDGAAQALIAADAADARGVEIALRLHDRTLIASGIVLA